MTNEEVHQIIRLEYILMSSTNPKKEALKLALEALDKQIPQPVVLRVMVIPVFDENGFHIGDDFEYDVVACPECGEKIGYKSDPDLYISNFCPRCGQALKEFDYETD